MHKDFGAMLRESAFKVVVSAEAKEAIGIEFVKQLKLSSEPTAHQRTEQFAAQLDDAKQRADDRQEACGATEVSIEEAAEDPDTLFAFRAAVEAAIRDGSPEKQRIVADTFVARSRVKGATRQAVTLNSALELLPKMSDDDLDFLAQLAVLYCERPSVLHDGAGERLVGMPERARLVNYLGGLDELIARCKFGRDLSMDDALQASTAGAIVIERSVSRNLEGVLSMLTPSIPSGVPADEILKFLNDLKFNGLWKDWDEVFQHTRLTPAGLVVGCLRADQAFGTKLFERWLYGRLRMIDEGVTIQMPSPAPGTKHGAPVIGPVTGKTRGSQIVLQPAPTDAEEKEAILKDEALQRASTAANIFNHRNFGGF